MSNRPVRLAALLLCTAVILIGTTPAVADAPDLSGPWYGTWGSPSTPGRTGRISLSVFGASPGPYLGVATFADLGVFDAWMPVTLVGNTVTIGHPSYLEFSGTLADDTIAGTTAVPSTVPPYYEVVGWQLFKDTGEETLPGAYPGAVCDALPDLFCMGSSAHCGELVPFEPVHGPGHVNYPANGETWENQYRSYLRRDLRQIVEYATAKVACMTEDWDYGNFAPLGLGDMSEVDGSIPGTSIGYPGHPPGTHEYGVDIDMSYYQLFAADNYMRVIGAHHDGSHADQYHLVEPPYALDVWRTALLLAYLSEHPRVRVIGVDGQAGLLLEDALDDLVYFGWIDAGLRESIPLAYEVEDTGRGWFRFHHHHLHVSLNPLADILDSVDLKPETLGCKSNGKTITAFLELAEGYDVQAVAADRVALILDGHTLLYAEPGRSKVGDHDEDGIPDLMVKFDRRRLLESIGTGDVELTLTGNVSGHFFQGTDTVRVKGKAK